MNTIIQQICQEFYSNICEFFENNDRPDLLTAERVFFSHINETARQLLEIHLNMLEAELYKDKAGRKAEQLTVVRRNDERTVLSKFGELRYHRTYYKDAQNNCYRYLVDEIAGVEKYQRVSTGVGLELAKAAQENSYAKSSQQVTGGKVSRQTVMNRIRKSQPVEEEVSEKRLVAVLHVDADEDHVTMVGGSKSIVPLISVYEGIERKGKRGKCKNVFHVSEYGKNVDELWEQVLSEIERRYDVEDTRIYLHGDGAAWIEAGLEWLPKSKFVLDKYHKNKSIKEMTVGLGQGVRVGCEKVIRQALDSGDKEKLVMLSQGLLSENPLRAEKIEAAASYLLKHINGIHICTDDAEANNGGCTEPHVSHVLSARLSSRPMKWSGKTLTMLAPMLAVRGELEPAESVQEISALQSRAVNAVRKSFAGKHRLGLPDPAAIGRIPVLSIGKNTPLKRAVQIYA